MNNNDLDQFDIRSNSKGLYYVPKEFGARVVPRVLERGRVYEPRTLEFICQNHLGMDVVSGGAFVGDFLPAISRSIEKDAKVWTFEPNPVSFRACKKTIEINRLRNVVLEQCAVGEVESLARLRVFDFAKNEPAAAQARIEKRGLNDNVNFVEVAVRKIDDIVEKTRQVSIIHLDIEGYEKLAIVGANETIRRCRPILILEGKEDISFYIKGVCGLSYTRAGKMEGNSIYVCIY